MHDFKNFPELTNTQMNTEYMESPHKQITKNFEATVTKVHDGDTVTLQWDERDFNFPMRIVEIDAPELNMEGGHDARDYLKGLVEGQLVQIIIDPENRVEKWGRLLGDIFIDGLLMSEDMMRSGNAWPFDRRREGMLPNMDKELNIEKWLPR
jgi:micrococcal nuclease